MTTTAPALRATDLRLDNRGARVYGPVELTADQGDLVVLAGPAGAGKTSLLLTLAGRMRHTGGELAVLGRHLPARAGQVRHLVALGTVPGVNDLDSDLTVAQHVAEALVLQQPWWFPWVRHRHLATALRRIEEGLAAARPPSADGDGPRLPSLRPDAFASDLTPLERMSVGVVLASIPAPAMLVVDDVDALRDPDDRSRAWTALAALDHLTDRHGHDHPLTVVVTCQDAGPDVRTVLERECAARGRGFQLVPLPAGDRVPAPSTGGDR